jgi:hypothetical protein
VVGQCSQMSLDEMRTVIGQPAWPCGS